MAFILPPRVLVCYIFASDIFDFKKQYEEKNKEGYEIDTVVASKGQWFAKILKYESRHSK